MYVYEWKCEQQLSRENKEYRECYWFNHWLKLIFPLKLKYLHTT